MCITVTNRKTLCSIKQYANINKTPHSQVLCRVLIFGGDVQHRNFVNFLKCPKTLINLRYSFYDFLNLPLIIPPTTIFKQLYSEYNYLIYLLNRYTYYQKHQHKYLMLYVCLYDPTTFLILLPEYLPQCNE